MAQYAAGIGRHFSYALLQAVSQLDEATLQHELDRLVEAELIYQQGVPPQASYMFKHALIQEAVSVLTEAYPAAVSAAHCAGLGRALS